MSLAFYLENHGVPQFVHTTPQAIQTWLNETPSSTNFEYLMWAFPIDQQAKLFQIRDVADWYGKLCNKIALGADLEVYHLGPDTLTRKNTIKKYLGLFMKELVFMALFDVDMQALMTSFMDRSTAALSILLVLLVADGVLAESTLTKLQVELTPFPRWQALGLPSLPTIEDIELALN